MRVRDVATDGTPVCRFGSARTYSPTSSHVYAVTEVECAKLRANPDWRFETVAFKVVPVSADAYVQSLMVDRGWTPEGVGVGVIACVPAR